MSAVRLLAAFVRRDWWVATSYRVPFVLDLSATLFNVALFFYVGRLVDRGDLAGRDGVLSEGYFAFVVVGLALLQIVQSGVSSFADRMRQEQTTGTLEALMATPAPTSLVVLGTAAFDMLRATVTGLFTFGLAVVVFGLRPEVGPALLAVPVALAAAIVLFAAIGVALAGFTVVYKQATGALSVVLPAIALAGGVYFPVSVLPQPLEAAAELFPVTWAVDVVRAALLSGDVLGGRLLLVVAGAAVSLPVALRVFDAALRRARREGTLVHY